MVHVRFINDQETVVTVPVRPDVDRWVLAVMPVKIKLELLRDTLGVNGGRDTDAAFTQHEHNNSAGETHPRPWVISVCKKRPEYVLRHVIPAASAAGIFRYIINSDYPQFF